MTDTAGSMRAIIDELSDELIERRHHIEAVAITLLAGKNGLLLGPPGSAKSLLIKSFAKRFIGCKYFEALLDKQLGKEELFGQIDLPLYDDKGVWERDVEDMLPTVHLAFLDEVGKAGPAVLNTLLKVLNEHEYKHGKKLIDTPTISVFGASNELLEDELEAFWDRFMVRMWVNYIQAPASFVSLIQSAVATNQQITTTTIELSDLEHAIKVDVPQIILPSKIADNITTLWHQVKEENIQVSDRRWRDSIRLLQASAYINGRSEIDADDLLILRHVLWNKPEQMAKVEELVLAFASNAIRICIEHEEAIDAMNAQLTALSGEGLKKDPFMKYAIDVKTKVKEAREQITELKIDALSGNKDVARIDRVANELKMLDIRVLMSIMNPDGDKAKMDQAKAASLVDKNWSDYPE